MGNHLTCVGLQGIIQPASSKGKCSSFLGQSRSVRVWQGTLRAQHI